MAHFVLVCAGDRVLLERRPPRGIWGGLWTPPEFSDTESAAAFLATRFGVAEPSRRLPKFRHAFTHFDLDIEPWVLEFEGGAAEAADSDARWHELASIETVGLPAPVARLLEELRDDPNGSMHQARPRGGRTRPSAVSR
jgi:A/G-specific adenine glycosylase